jgi:hypothetical protein
LVGKDVIFLAGMTPYIDEALEAAPQFLSDKEHIKVGEFLKYLRKTYPPEKNPLIKDYSQIGITILSIQNGKSVISRACQGYHNYTLIESILPSNVASAITVDGINSEKILAEANKVFGKAIYFKRNPKNFVEIYQNSYFEGVGGDILVYSLDENGLKQLHRESLKEENLKYVDETEYNYIKPDAKCGMCIKGSTMEASIINGSVLNGTTINGGAFNSTGYGAGYLSKTNIDDGFIQTHFIKVSPMNLITQDFSPDSSGYLALSPSSIGFFNGSTQSNFNVTSDGTIQGKYMTLTDNLNVGTINGSLPITNLNMYNYLANKTHGHSSLEINPSLTPSYNINYPGSINGASVTWCNSTFQPLTASDMRLKKNIRNLDELPDDLYYSLKPKLFEFKCEPYKQNVSNIGLLAQEVISAFKNYSLDAFQYGIVEYADVRSYTDECLYITGEKLLRISYDQFITWGILINQKLYDANNKLANRVDELETKVNLIIESVGK